MGQWTLTILQGEAAIKMMFADINDISEFIKWHEAKFGKDTKFVFMNNSGPDVEVSKKYHFEGEEVPLPDGF